jgi:outer membrane biosynthesis protein TonB
MADETLTYEKRIEAARLASNRGDRAEAERLLIEALLIGERTFGAEHPSLGTALNELGRLYIRQGQHECAEEVLERLLRITRTKGEEHPDVATALAGLAVVKRALDDDAAAEQLFRGALRIRERALAPQHMATVVTMEQLSETCAARGNVAEALTLLQRALPTREAALGADHATVRGLRARIADLELRALASSFASSRPELDPILDFPASSSSTMEAAAPAIGSAPDATSTAHSSEPARRPRRKRFVFVSFASVAAIALATAGMTARSRANAAGVQATAAPEAVIAAPTAGSTAAVTNAALTTSGSESATGIVQAGTPKIDSVAPVAAPSLPRVPKNLAAVTSQLIATTNADSLVRASTKLDRELASEKIGTGIVASSHVDDAGARPAVLMAPAPLPHFPDELRGQWSESEVVVRFRVDERGRVDVASLKVLKSDHDRFVIAVREVLPRFRFEPARSAAPESKPVADWVDYRVKFAAAK